jgi:hypothetical protein
MYNYVMVSDFQKVYEFAGWQKCPSVEYFCRKRPMQYDMALGGGGNTQFGPKIVQSGQSIVVFSRISGF